MENTRSVNIVSKFITELKSLRKAEDSLKVTLNDVSSLKLSGEKVTSAKGLDWRSKIDESSDFDLILGDFPIGMSGKQQYSYGTRKYKIRRNWGELLSSLQFLRKGGMGIFLIEPYGFGSFEGTNFEKTLNMEGFYVNAIFNAPEGLLLPSTRINPILIVISKTKTDPIFLAELLNEAQSIKVATNFFTEQDGSDLSSGIKIPEKIFRGFDQLKAIRQMEQLETQYNEFEKYSVGDIAVEINYVKHGDSLKERENSVYIPKIGNSAVISKISKSRIKHHNYFQVVLDERAINEYVSAFFRSNLGKLILQALTAGAVIPHLNKHDLEQAIIALPSLDVQRQILITQKKMHELKLAIDEFDNELALNPISSNAISEQLDTMLDAIGGLTEADKISSLLRQGESKKCEFKETLSLDVRKNTKEKYIELSSLKTIVAFLNTEGGTLLIGVDDDGTIVGVDIEIDKFHKSHDKFLLHFKNLIQRSIGEEFYPYIEYKLIQVGGRYILGVECAESISPCYLDNSGFYVRTNPATDKLEGPKLVEYVKNHFN